MRPALILVILAILVTGAFTSCGDEALSVPLNLVPETPALTTPVTTPSPMVENQEPPTPSYPSPTLETVIPTPAPPQITPSIEPEPGPPPVFRVVGYITHWRFSRLAGMKLEGLTHLIWQGVEVTDAGNPTLRVSGNGDWGQIPALVETGHSSGVKVLVSLIGFWNDSDLSKIWESAEQRKRLIENLKDLVETYNLDGIDIDNESGCDREVYSTFVKELHDALSPPGKIITLAGSPYNVCINRDVFQYVDFINLMTYDMVRGKGYPYHSTLEESAQALNLWVDEEMPKDKILMGIPFHGRDDYDGYFEYWWIVDRYNPGPDQNQASEPNAAGNVIWWNGAELVKEKVVYARDNGFGGVMMYELGTDSVGSLSLLESVYDALTTAGDDAGKNQ